MFFKGTARRGVGAIARETKSAGGYLNASTTLRSHHLLHGSPRLRSRGRTRHPVGCPAQFGGGRGRAGARAPGHHPGGEAQARHAVRGRLRDAARGDVRPPPHPPVADRSRGPARPAHPRRSLGLLPLSLRARADHRRDRRRGGPRAGARAGAAGVRRLALGRRGGGPLAGGARAPRGPRPHPSRRREPGRAGAGLAGGAAAAPRCARARSRRGGARLGAGQLAIPLAAGAGHRHLGRCAQLRAHRAGGLQRRAPSCGRSGCGAALDRNCRGGVPTGADRARRRKSWIAPAPWCAPAGPAGSSRWKAGRSALAAAEALEDVELLDREYALLAEVSPTDVREAAARHLLPDAVAGVVYLPSDGAVDLTSETPGPHLCGDRASRRRPTAPRPRPERRPAVPARPAREHGVWVTRLAGADLLVYRKAGVPLVNLGIYVPAARFDPPAQAGLGVARWCAASVRGAGELDAAALAFAFERLGGSAGHQRGRRLARLRRLGAVRESGRGRRAAATPVFTRPHLERCRRRRRSAGS